jgi:hypothetical protein
VHVADDCCCRITCLVSLGTPRRSALFERPSKPKHCHLKPGLHQGLFDCVHMSF